MNKENFRPLATLILAILCLIWSGCAPSQSACAGASGPNCEYQILPPVLVNARFEIHPNPPSLASSGLWIRTDTNPNVSDSVALRWNELSVLKNKRNVTCNFEFPNADCERCNVCGTTAPGFCNSGIYYYLFDPIQLYTFSGFMSQMPASATSNPATNAGCDTASPGIILSPTSNVTYQLKRSPVFFDQDPAIEIDPSAETRVHVLNGGTAPVQYELSRHTQAGMSDALRQYIGTVPKGVGAVLQDNFSSRVAIGKVRVLKGTPEINAVGDLSLKDAVVLKPSRIFFIPNFTGTIGSGSDGSDCYARYSAATPDGDIDLTTCRSTNNATQPSPIRATPVYLSTAPNDLVTWVVEFNPDDFPAIGGGEPPPTLAAGETIAVEFTIQ